MSKTYEIPVEEPMFYAWDIDYITQKIKVRFTDPTPKMGPFSFLHVCHDTNTFVLDVYHDDMPGEDPDVIWDAENLEDTPLPFGQIVMLAYYGEGEFVMIGSTDRYKPGLVEEAFRSFGYTDVKVRGHRGDYVKVSKKDVFKLKLRFGH